MARAAAPLGLWLGLLLAAGPARADEQALIDAWVLGSEGRPSLHAVQAAAVEALDLESDDRVQGWSDRARNRAWLPRLDLRLGTDRDQAVRRPGTADVAWSEGQGLGADLALRWGFGELVFSETEIRIEATLRSRDALKRSVKEAVTRVFFERLEVELRSRAEPEEEEALQLEAARLDGILGALTGGLWGRS